MNDRVNVTLQGGVADVRLNRPTKRNALDGAMFEALIGVGDRLRSEPRVRAVVLSGEGGHFCAGMDVANLRLLTRAPSGGAQMRPWDAGVESRPYGIANRLQYAVWVWREIPVPVIAAVEGVALGNGFQLTLGADLRIVSPDAELGLVEVDWGMVPDMCGAALMRRLAREDVVRELIFTGRRFSGDEALTMGFATHVSSQPHEVALDMARLIAGKSPDAVRAAKRLLNGLDDNDTASAFVHETEEQNALMGRPNQIEAVSAQLQRRAPVFADARG